MWKILFFDYEKIYNILLILILIINWIMFLYEYGKYLYFMCIWLLNISKFDMIKFDEFIFIVKKIKYFILVYYF